MEEKKVNSVEDDLEDARKQDSEVSAKLAKAGGKLLTSLFNPHAFKDVGNFIDNSFEILTAMIEVAYGIKNKSITSSSLKMVKGYADKSKSPFIPDIDKAISDWHEQNPDMQQYACPEFRKPDYPKFMRKPF